jgi:selenocysteine lyase/cysteine desulfurase
MNFSDQFPALNNCTYLNTASSGILSKAVVNWRRSHDETFEKLGSGFRLTQESFLKEVRINVSRFFGAKTENTFLVPNCSFGLNAVLDGLSGEQRVLLFEGDYPSVNYPVESRGFECDYVKLDSYVENNIAAKVKAFKPTVLAISLVQYTNGIKVDLDFIRTLKLENPDLLIVADGTQFCGTAQFDFESSGIDVLISSGYKWMLAGYGNGFVLIKDTAADELYKDRKPRPMPVETFLKGRSPLSLCFEPGHLDTLNFGTLNESILYMEKLGIDVIANKISTLAQKAKAAFTELGLLSEQVVGRAQHSSIFNLQVSDELFWKFSESNIVAISRGKGVRVGFHFYNTEADLDHLLQVIKAYRTSAD